MENILPSQNQTPNYLTAIDLLLATVVKIKRPYEIMWIKDSATKKTAMHVIFELGSTLNDKVL